MHPQLSFKRSSVLALSLVAAAPLVTAGPCDIYSSGGTPCVAAHSTTRALYNAYTGSLYQVKRGSDGATTIIAPRSAGGVANAAAQDSFCAGTTCLITIIYDHAIGAPVTLNGQKAYGVFISPGTGYRNNAVTGTATGDAAEGMYAVLDGTHYNGDCCFDYGNAEISNTDTGNGHMEAIYFGDSTVWGSGSGSGPWVMADLENGLFSGADPKQNTQDPSISYRFLTAAVKGRPNQWAIRGGNAAANSLSTYYSGARLTVSGYNPMSKEGAIILGIGGDNSHGSQGTFYEGAMTSGYPSDATENSVQANIVAAKYATTSSISGPGLTASLNGQGNTIRSWSYPTRYFRHYNNVLYIASNGGVDTFDATALFNDDVSFVIGAGFA
ncbi:Alpha-L-arabinofuranosidase [Fusarium piperis]|uniref:Alpha-L-arabinofuranosidase n=1 Tax=Fusarium piperis TaxID=1435070 RepID=A0A9W8W4B0_9HYPO|nr:Alpha-L-arabinofuranosidase [Fusarium piperis]